MYTYTTVNPQPAGGDVSVFSGNARRRGLIANCTPGDWHILVFGDTLPGALVIPFTGDETLFIGRASIGDAITWPLLITLEGSWTRVFLTEIVEQP